MSFISYFIVVKLNSTYFIDFLTESVCSDFEIEVICVKKSAIQLLLMSRVALL